MSNTWKRILSLLLAIVMMLSLGVTGFAEGAEEEEASQVWEAEPEEDVLEPDSYELSPDSLNVPKLGQEDAEDAFADGEGRISLVGEPVEEELVDLNEVVRVSIFLEEPSALAAGYSTDSVNCTAAVSYRNGLRARQAKMTARIESAIGHSLNVHWNLTLAANAIAAELSLAEMVKVEAIPGVRSVQRENQYYAMDDEDAEPNTAHTSDEMVGATAAWALGYTGAGSRIAIIDTGIDTSHQSFDADAFNYAIQQTGKTVELMGQVSSSVAAQLNSKSSNYVSDKIPYGYNYVDGNTTITHMEDTQGEHGSHVAGIAAANRFIKNGSNYDEAVSSVGAVGMAPDAQLLIMKVFGSDGGAYDSDYMAAIEDAIVLQADVVNLSLGSASQGFTFSNSYQDILNNLVNKEKNEKMVVSISAGNAYDLPHLMDRTEKLLYKEDVSMHTGGSPGSYVNSLCVAAAQNTYTKGRALNFGNGLNVFFYESTGNEEQGTTYSNPAISTIAGTQLDFVYIDAAGESADYAAVNSAVSLSDKVVIVNRGAISFAEKGNNAKSYNPKAVIIANNQDGTIYMDLTDFTGSFPMVTITQADAERVKAAATQTTAGGYTCYTGTVQVTTSDVEVQIDREQATITDFSSWGVPGSLLMKPEITAPGGDIYSVWGANNGADSPQSGHDQYESMSGTSMAAPHITGLTAVLAQYLRENPITNTELAGYSTRAIAQSLMMSTATPMQPGGGYLPVLQQGAGLADVNRAINAESVIMMSTADDNLTVRTGAAADGKVKVELGDDPGRDGTYSFSFTLYNLTDTDQVYTLRTDLFTQAVKNDTYMSKGTMGLDFGVSYTWNGEEPQVESHDVDGDGDTDRDDAQAILDHVSGKEEIEDEECLLAANVDGDELISSQDAYQLLGLLDAAAPEGYVLAANGTADVTVTITLTAAQKAELDDLFRDEWSDGGAYIQGYTYVSTASSTREGVKTATEHSIPILGFYGAWTDATMFDTTSYTQYLYETENSPVHQEPYAAGSEYTNYLRLQQNGQKRYFTGNPYMVEESFPADRLAINSSTVLQTIGYNLIRGAGTTGYAVTKLDENGLVTDILSSGITGREVYGLYYSNSGGWQNTTTKTYSLNKTPADYGLQQGERFRAGFYAIPEYNAMLVNDSYNTASSGILNVDGFNTLLKSNALGKGAFVGYDFVVDNTDPTIDEYSLDGSTLSVTASDNEALAYVAVLSLDGTVQYAEKAPGTDTYTVSFDASDAIANAPGYVAVFAGDYAGNEVARALKVNDNAYQTKVVYVQTDTVTAGEEYLILNTASAGTGYALAYTLNTSGTTATVARSSTPVLAGTDKTGNKPYVESAAATAVWTAGNGSASGTYTFNNNGWYLRSSNTNNLTITADTSRRDWTWNGANNRLSNNNRFLRYYNNTFSLNSATNSVYLYQKTTILTDTPLDPYAVTEVTVTPASLDLYKGSTADLTAKVLPLTAEDRSVTWSSSNTSVATVDQTGRVTAVGAGSADIIAAANGDPTKTATCAVKVTSINKTLNAIIWDESGEVYFSSFNANNVSKDGWTALHNDPVGTYLTSAFMANTSTLYAGTLDSSDASTVLYTVDRGNNYALTEFGNNYVGAFGMARASTRYTGYFVYGFAKYLIFGNLTPENEDPDDSSSALYSGLPYGLLDLSTTSVGDAYVCGVCARSVGTTSSSFYFLDETGKIWQTTLSIGSSVTFGTPTLLVDTGIGTSFLYQSLYYDGTYLYWSHCDGEVAELIIINTSTKAIYHAGDFGEGVWPAAGLYVNGAVAPASVDDDVMAEPLQLERVASYGDLMTRDVIERLTAAFAEYGLEFTVTAPETEPVEDEELPADPEEPVIEPVEEPAEEPTITPVEDPIEIPIEDPVIEPVEETGSTEPVFGTLQAFRAAPGIHVADLNAYTDPEEDTDAKELIIRIGETEATHNGLIAVSYDPELLSYVDYEKADCLSHISVFEDTDKGVITIAYANKAETGSDDIPAETVFVTLRFTTGCTGGSEEEGGVEITTLERNDELELNEGTFVNFSGAGHDWGEPAWTWAEDYSSATVSGTCDLCGEEYTANAEITSVTVDATCEQAGKITYTATAEWADGTTVTDVKEVTLEAIGHDWGEVDYAWAADNSTVTATRVCQNDASHKETETVNTTSQVTRPATCEAAGEITYTATFTNSAFTTQTKTVTVEAIGHDWGEATWTWAEDYSSATVSATCDLCGEEYTANANVTSEKVDATCEQAGKITYTATAEWADGSTVTDVKEVTIAATGHVWGEPVWTWAEDYSSASVTRTCDLCDQSITKDAVVTSETEGAGCDQPGKITYTATVEWTDGTTLTDVKEVTVEAIGHDWGEVDYAWAADNSTVTATRVCQNDASHKETETVNTTSQVTRPATCEQNGETTYTATFTNLAFETQTKTIEAPAATGHDWGEATWTWAEDYSSATVSATCSVCGEEYTANANVTSEKVDATCEQAGKITYTATAEWADGSTVTDVKEVTIAATGHQWGEPVWTWAEDYSSATVSGTCSVCGKEYTATAEITSEKVDATCEQAGKITYTATAQWADGSTVTDVKEVAIEATGHDWGEATWTWAEDYSSATVSATCDLCGEEYTANANVTSEKVDATCEQAGKITYTATAEWVDGSTVTDVKEVTIAATGHQWGEPEWTWAEDYSSATVTFTCSVCGETVTKTAEITVTHEDGGTTYTATVELDGTVYTDVRIEGFAMVIGKSLSLKGKIAMNVYLYLPESVTSDPGAYVTINDVQYPVSQAQQSEVRANTGYRFTTEVKFAHLLDEQVLRLYNGRGELLPLQDSEGNDLTETGFVYRVQDYIEYVRANSEDEKWLAVVNALSDLGSLAQAQFKYNEDSCVQVVGDLASVTADMVKEQELQLSAVENSGIRYYGSSLLLKEDTIIRHYFKLDGGELGDYTFIVDGEEVTPKEKSGLYYVEKTGIVARDLDKSFRVEVKKGDELVIGLDYSALSYAYTQLSRGKTDTLTDLTKAVVLYSKAAEEFFTD